ncbi:MAG: HAD family hydrolase [Lachnospira sp.]|nr:HAD family hydrolase [Lachnospira sp.]
MIKAVLFDLDGTLLPMNQDEFVKLYMGLMAKKMSGYGYDPELIVKAIWSGTDAMYKNNGNTTNEEVFWEEFGKYFDRDVRADEPVFEDFYNNEFAGAKQACGYNEKAKRLVETAKGTGCKVVLATNPIFPPVATRKRIMWAGISEDDFGFVTTYDNSHFSKPNKEYYKEIIAKLGVKPQECLMIGNDVTEDMVAKNLGMEVFLVTDYLINKEDEDISQYPNGSLEEAIEYVKTIAK